MYLRRERVILPDAEQRHVCGYAYEGVRKLLVTYANLVRIPRCIFNPGVMIVTMQLL